MKHINASIDHLQDLPVNQKCYSVFNLNSNKICVLFSLIHQC